MEPQQRLDLLSITPPFPVMDVYRKGDIFADNEPGKQGQIKSACYEAIARSDFFGNTFSIASQIASAFTVPIDFVIGVLQPILSALGFLASGDRNPHYSPFNIDGGLQWCRQLLQGA